MAQKYAIEQFLNADGDIVRIGEKAPEESGGNLKQYEKLGLLGTEAEIEKRYPGTDIGRPGLAEKRKAKAAAKKAAGKKGPSK